MGEDAKRTNIECLDSSQFQVLCMVLLLILMRYCYYTYLVDGDDGT